MAFCSKMIGSPYPSTIEWLLYILFIRKTILWFHTYFVLKWLPEITKIHKILFLFEQIHVYVPLSGYGVPTASITVFGLIKIGSKAPQSLICKETIEYSFILLKPRMVSPRHFEKSNCPFKSRVNDICNEKHTRHMFTAGSFGLNNAVSNKAWNV